MIAVVLQGLKIKEVKQLCYEQLKNMDSEEVKKAIAGESRKLKDEEEEEEEDEEERQIGVKEILELTEDLEASSEKREASSNDSSSGKEVSCRQMRESSSTNVRLSPSASQETPRKEEYELCVSDVSEGESSEDDNDRGEARESFSTPCTSQDASILAETVRTRESSPQTPSEDRIELTADSPAGDIDRELYEEPVEEEESVCVKEQDSCSLESSQAMEMLLRQRALEAVLRRSSRTSGGSESCAELQEGGQTVRDEYQESPPESPGYCDELEQKLRLRALQSMFSKQQT